jgi:hypothetical protein
MLVSHHKVWHVESQPYDVQVVWCGSSCFHRTPLLRPGTITTAHSSDLYPPYYTPPSGGIHELHEFDNDACSQSCDHYRKFRAGEGEKTFRVLILHGSHYSDGGGPMIDLLLVSVPPSQALDPFSKLDAKVPDYEAISYAWGDSKLCCTVRCSSRTPIQYIAAEPYKQEIKPSDVWCQMAVSQTVLDILVDLQPRTGYTLLWIDAICVNQRDTSDRREQVQLMSAIYRLAREVVVWLPFDSKTLSRFRYPEVSAADVVNKLQSVDIYLHGLIYGPTFAVNNGEKALRNAKFFQDSEFQTLGAILSQRYFSRTWVRLG